ncbi:MAG: response regulator transcription factor [Acidobacteria bacterium]|nr:response regulator transcription factor [Acidobacteriota bacterium]
MKPRIAIVEDDPDLLRLIKETLMKAGYSVMAFSDGKSFHTALEKLLPDLVVLDLMLPDADGLDICRKIRGNAETADIAILILTARGGEADRVLGLELGADDYVTKPFSLRELTARVKAILRRSIQKDPHESLICIGDVIRVNPETYEVFVHEAKVELTSTEFRILCILGERKGRVYTRETLLDRLWGKDKIVMDRTVDVHVKNLREKLGEAGAFIRCIRGVGYKIEE